MAPVDILIQTDQVVHFLLADEEEIQARAFEDEIQSDCPGKSLICDVIASVSP